jgi:hypothetical protein
MPVSDVVRVGRKSGVQMLSAGRKDALADLSQDGIGAVLRAITHEYENVVINAGALDDGLTVLADAVAGYSRQAILAVRDGAFGLSERQAMKALAANSDTVVSVMSVEIDGAINRAA